MPQIWLRLTINIKYNLGWHEPSCQPQNKQTMDISEDIRLDSGLVIYRDWDCEGAIRMRNAKTIKRYKGLQNESSNIDVNALGVFFAFSDKQFEEGRQELIDKGYISSEDKIYRLPISGGFGTKQGYHALIETYSKNVDRIREECDPQEVYFYEYNNHECMISWDGDYEAIRHIIGIWGKDVAKRIVRFNDSKRIEDIIKEDAA